MPSARIVVAVLCTRRPGKQHHIGYHGNSRAENETILHASLRECKQVGGLTRLMCSRYVGQRPTCSTIDPPSERAMPAAAAVSSRGEVQCSMHIGSAWSRPCRPARELSRRNLIVESGLSG